MQSLTQRREAQMLEMARNNDGSGVHVATATDKRTASALEARGLVTVRRTTVKCAGLVEWWLALPLAVEVAS